MSTAKRIFEPMPASAARKISDEGLLRRIEAEKEVVARLIFQAANNGENCIVKDKLLKDTIDYYEGLGYNLEISQMDNSGSWVIGW